jgi:membrane-associated phospholipid phosphatase
MKAWLYDWGGLNTALFHVINAHHWQWLDRLMLALTWAGDHDRFPAYLAIGALVCWWRFTQAPASPAARTWTLALVIFSVAYFLDGLLVVGLKSALDLPRPSAVFSPDSMVVVGTAEFKHSFPSGHASFAALLGAVLWPTTRRALLRLALVIFVVGVCLSRPYLGFHFPADVLLGSIFSLLLVMAVHAALMQLNRRQRDRLRL